MVITLKSKWHFALLATFLYVTIPLVEAVYYMTEQGRRAYPSNADTIAIPICESGAGMLFFSPVYALAIWLTVRSYWGGRSLLAFDTNTLVRSGILSLFLGGWAFFDLYNAAFSAYRLLPLDMITDLLWAYLLLCLRSSLAGGGLIVAEQNTKLGSTTS